jgi:hypothetical protein
MICHKSTETKISVPDLLEAVHSVYLIDVYLDLESPRGSGFWVGEGRRVTEGTKRGQFTSIREQRWMGPDARGGFQVSRQGEQGEQGEQRGARGTRGIRGTRGKSCT